MEAELAPQRATLLVRIAGPAGKRLVPLATRGKEALASISRTLLAQAGSSGVLVQDALYSRELHGARSVILHSLRSMMVVPSCLQQRAHPTAAAPIRQGANVADGREANSQPR